MNEKELAELKAANMADPVSGFDPGEHGHESLADLFREIRADEAAAKRADAHGHGYGQPIPREGKDAGRPGNGPGRGPER